MGDRLARTPASAMTIIVLIPLVCITDLCAAAPIYTAINLGTIANLPSAATDINNAGQIVGTVQASGNIPSRAFLYQQGILIDLSGYFAGSSSAAAINDSGVIVGQGQFFAHGSFSGFQITGNTVTNLVSTNNARSINQNGDIVGNTSNISGNRAYLENEDSFIDIHAAIYGADSYANAVNASQQVAGYFQSYTNGNHAYIYDHGTVTDLAPLLGGQSWAYGINDNGQVVGYTDSGGGEGFLYSAGTIQILGNWGAGGINNKGQVVGGGYLYDNGTTYDLLSLLDTNAGWSGIQAASINDSGQIVGYGFFNGAQRAILLNPVPEPESLFLLLAGAMTFILPHKRPLAR